MLDTSLSGQLGNILLTGGQQQAQQLDAAAQAKAGGIIGSSNAVTNAFGNIANTAAGQVQLSDLLGNKSGYGSNASVLPYSGLNPELMAKGGPVRKGRAFIVGERGPELFVPSKNGKIIPNHKIRLHELAA